MKKKPNKLLDQTPLKKVGTKFFLCTMCDGNDQIIRHCQYFMGHFSTEEKQCDHFPWIINVMLIVYYLYIAVKFTAFVGRDPLEWNIIR